ncbi:MAG TPA: HEAT repeat domain-containing protein [Chthoniobacteraceae bacterium]|nr:HEAT repeat domain-containing protein [Chthoniobacteraceae bacterium]
MKIFLMFVMLMTLAAGGVLAGEEPGLPAWMVKPGEIEATLAPDKASIMAGEPVFATMTLVNKSGRDLWITPSGQFGLLEQRRDAIHLAAVDKEGRKAAAFPWAGPYGRSYDGWDGSGEERKFPAGGKLDFRVCVTGWVVLDRPGIYTLSAAQVVFALKLRQDPPIRGGTHAGAQRVVVRAQTMIGVVPADHSKMAALIGGLVKFVSAGRDGPSVEEVQMLETTSDTEVIPWLCSRVRDRNEWEAMQAALRGLMRFKEDAAFDGMKEALKTVEENPYEASAVCGFILHSANPDAVKWLETQEHAKSEVVAEYAKAVKGISATLVAEKPAMLPGEPIYASFIVKNNSDAEATIYLHDDSETQYGQDPDTGSGGGERNIKLTAVDKEGAKVAAVPFPPEAEQAVESHGMPISTPVKIAAGGSHEFKLFLPWRLALGKAGDYTLAADCVLRLNYKETEDAPVVFIPLRATAPLEVLQKDDARMGNLIDALVQKASQKPEDSHTAEAQDAAFRLRWISDERVIPYFKRMAKSDNATQRVIAMAALAKFNNDEALDCLKEGLEIAELPEPLSRQRDNFALTDLHEAAFRGLIHSEHPGAIPYLMSQRKNLESDMRLELMDAVAKLPAKEAVPMLQQMQDDLYGWVAEHSGEYLSEIAAGIPMTAPEDDGEQE